MKKLTIDIDHLKGETIKEINYQRDTDYNEGIFIRTESDKIAFIYASGSDGDSNINLSGDDIPSRFNIEFLLRIGIITQEEHDQFKDKFKDDEDKNRIHHLNKDLNDMRKKRPDLFND